MKVRELMSALSRCDPELPVYVQDANAQVADVLDYTYTTKYDVKDYWEGGGICDDLEDGDRYVAVGA
jgi:hypothetical protein